MIEVFAYSPILSSKYVQFHKYDFMGCNMPATCTYTDIESQDVYSRVPVQSIVYTYTSVFSTKSNARYHHSRLWYTVYSILSLA